MTLLKTRGTRMAWRQAGKKLLTLASDSQRLKT